MEPSSYASDLSCAPFLTTEAPIQKSSVQPRHSPQVGFGCSSFLSPLIFWELYLLFTQNTKNAILHLPQYILYLEGDAKHRSVVVIPAQAGIKFKSNLQVQNICELDPRLHEDDIKTQFDLQNLIFLFLFFDKLSFLNVALPRKTHIVRKRKVDIVWQVK